MKTIQVQNRTRQQSLGEHILVADTFWTRLRGMLGRPEPQSGEGLLIIPSKSVHMWGMKYPLDVLVLDEDQTILATYTPLEPGQHTSWHSKGRMVLELPAGQVQRTQTQVGDQLTW